MLSLAPTHLFTGESLVENAVVHVRDGRIASIAANPASDAVRLDGLLAPGFLDLQVNGGGGILFNDSPTVESLETIAAAHRAFGVTGFLATLISDERPKIAQTMEAVGEAMKRKVEGLAGLHLEGPWLAPPRRGVHPQAFLRRFDAEDVRLLARKHSFPLLITVAPEQISLEQVKALAEAGVIVSLGHTAANAEDIERYLDAGARGFTHLFNAMPPLESRTPGPVGAALGRRDSWAGLILDGVHVHPHTARAAFAAKTARNLVLVSDSMATVGSPSHSMSLFGEAIEVRNAALRTSAGTLAGAHLELSSAVRNAVSFLGASETEALQMASRTPAEFMRLDHDRGLVAPGRRADFVLLNKDLQVMETWIAGRRVS